MSYPPAVRESLAKVEASRSRRLRETFPRHAPQERESLLSAFHPDYIADAFREIRLGPNKGDRAPRELADVLEGPSLVFGPAPPARDPQGSGHPCHRLPHRDPTVPLELPSDEPRDEGRHLARPQPPLGFGISAGQGEIQFRPGQPLEDGRRRAI